MESTSTVRVVMKPGTVALHRLVFDAIARSPLPEIGRKRAEIIRDQYAELLKLPDIPGSYYRTEVEIGNYREDIKGIIGLRDYAQAPEFKAIKTKWTITRTGPDGSPPGDGLPAKISAFTVWDLHQKARKAGLQLPPGLIQFALYADPPDESVCYWRGKLFHLLISSEDSVKLEGTEADQMTLPMEA